MIITPSISLLIWTTDKKGPTHFGNAAKFDYDPTLDVYVVRLQPNFNRQIPFETVSFKRSDVKAFTIAGSIITKE